MNDSKPGRGRRPQDVLTRFWSKVERRGLDDCWRWQGPYLPSGYGAFWFGHNNVTAQRAAYALLVGTIPAGAVVRHSCDHKWCVNPRHLSIGTQAQNIQDKIDRNRQARGETHGNSTRTEDMVRRIKEAYALGRRQTSIAFCAGVDRGFVNRVVHGDSWGHIRPDLTVHGRKRVARHSDDLVRRIKEAYALGHRQTSIAFCAGVDARYVNRVVRGLSRQNVE